MSNAERQTDQRVNALVFLFLLLVVPLAYFLNIWADEASTLYTTQRGFFDALQNAAANEKQAPFYFWIMSLWRMASGSIFFARLFSVICCAIAIKLFAKVASHILEPRASFIATAFFAFHPFLIWAGLEIRVYALVILLSVLLIKFFIDANWGKREDAPWLSRVSFVIVAIAALYTNYYLVFVLAGLLVALVVTRRWRAAVIYGSVLVIVGLAFVPMLFAMREQLAVNTSGYRPDTSLFDGVQQLWRHFLTFTLPAGIFQQAEGSSATTVRIWMLRIALFIVAIFAVRNRASITRYSLGGFAFVATIFAGLLVAYFVVGPDYVEIRHASVLFVPLVLFLAVFLTDIFGKVTSKAALIIPAFVVLLFFAYSLTNLYPNMTKRGDWARVGAFIEQNEKAGQPIVVFTTFDALALPYHYHGQNRVLPDEKFFAFEQEAKFGSVDSLRRQTDFVISEIPSESQEIWLVVNEKCLTTEACVPLQNFIGSNYTIETEQEFYLEKVFLLRKKVK